MDFLLSLKSHLISQSVTLHNAILSIEYVEKQLAESEKKDQIISDLISENSFFLERERRNLAYINDETTILKPLGIELDQDSDKYGIWRYEDGEVKKVSAD